MVLFFQKDRDFHGTTERKEYAMSHRPPPYELFFAPLEVALPPQEYEQVRFAYFASKFGHAGQEREGGGRYFDHPKAAAWIYISELHGRDSRAIVNLLLHDLSEDTYLLSGYRLSLNFGEDIALDVRALTKLPKGKETTDQYLHRINARGPQAIIAKICDRLHNLRTLDDCAREKQIRTIKETEEYHLPLLISALETCPEPWSAYAKPLQRMIREAIMRLQ